MRRELLAAACLILPAPAWAQPLSGPYVGFGAGAVVPQGELQHVPRDAGAAAPTRGLDPGAAEVGSLGYGLGNGLRLEVQGYHQADRARAVGAPGP